MDKKASTYELEKQWKSIYVIGGIAALLAFGGTLFDIIFGSISSANLTELPYTAVERFSEFQHNWFLGLYHLDLVNVIIAIIMIPTYFALFAVHRKRNIAYAGFALVICMVGTIIFTASNSALPMLELSQKYVSTVDAAQQSMIAAAGEAMLIKGGHGSLGAFFGFFFSTIASLSMSLVMLQGKIFSRLLSILGVIGYTLLLIYVVLVTFVPATHSIAVAMAAPGGILALIWILVVGIKLIRLGIAAKD